MEYTDSSGNIIGFDMDMMNIVAQKLGVPMVPIVSDFDPITSGAVFAAKTCDLSAAAISITDARKKVIQFSTPYFDASQSLVTKTTSGIKTLADMKGKKLSVQTDTTGSDYANANSAQDGYTVVTFDDAGVALSSVLSGQVDACLLDKAIVYSFVDDNPTTSVVSEIQTGEQYGYAGPMTPTGQALIALVNQVLATADSDGTFLNLYKKWIDPKATAAGLPK